ncbi:MAG: hypothetical protein HY271_02635 [Deltaproteobacteria bacterium]|nr:hypothetical protein [Deltaproteobacteria bacterium]
MTAALMVLAPVVVAMRTAHTAAIDVTGTADQPGVALRPVTLKLTTTCLGATADESDAGC